MIGSYKKASTKHTKSGEFPGRCPQKAENTSPQPLSLVIEEGFISVHLQETSIEHYGYLPKEKV
jgi:hypothetical protein